jgi:hypothetical protein
VKKHVHILYGQFGYSLSAGMHAFGETLKPKGFSVTCWNWDQHRKVALAIAIAPDEDKNAVAGFSLGGNACAWIANDAALYGKTIDLLAAYDPTVNGPPLSQFPIGKNVKRAICYRQMGFVLTSMFVGRGYLRAAADGPTIEEHRFTADHLYVPYMQSLHDRTLQALEAM